jgi:hypothetical protein
MGSTVGIMTARDELALVISESLGRWNANTQTITRTAEAILAAGYYKPRIITTAEELDALPFGAAVETSDSTDTVVLKGEGDFFRNQSGYEVSSSILWRFGGKPFTVLYEGVQS